MNKLSLTIAIPCLEEIDNFDDLSSRISDVIPMIDVPYSFLFVGPPSGERNMREKVEAAGFKYIARTPSSTYGDAVRAAIQSSESTYIGFMDADNSHDPIFLVNAQPFLKAGADLVVGSRYMIGGSSDNGFFSRFLSHMTNFIFRTILGTKLSDLSNSQKIYRRELLLGELKADNFDIIEELVWRIIGSGKRPIIHEIPATFEKRKFGKTKRSFLPFVLGFSRTALRLSHLRIRARLGN